MTCNILFIGNSYTYFNDMPTAYFENIAKSAGFDVSVKSVTRGGWTLEKLSDINDEHGALVDKELKENKFAFVVLQEQSLRPATTPERFELGVKRLLEKVKANGATPFLYCTWGRKDGSPNLADQNWTSEEMTQKIAVSYTNVGKIFNIAVAYVGLAFAEIYTSSPEIELYNPDFSHPSAQGSYLAALTIFAKIFNVSPHLSTFDAGFGEEVDTLLKNAAYNAVFNTPKIK